MSINIGVMDTRGRWMVNNDHLYIPSIDPKIDHTNIASADSGRTQNGVMHITWIRRDVVKVSMTWKALTGNELRRLENLLQGKTFRFTYYDKGETRTINGYCGEMSYTLHTYSGPYKNVGGLYTNISANVEQR